MNTWSGAFQQFGESKAVTAVKPKPGAFSQILLQESATDPEEVGREQYLSVLRSPAPTFPVSDHLRETTRLRGAIFVALRVLSEQAASAEVTVHRWDPDAREGGDQDAREPLPRSHPLCSLLRRPNPQDSKGLLLRRMVQQICLTGTSLLWRVDDAVMPIELWSVPTGTYTPVPISAQYPNGAYRILPWFPGPLSAGTRGAGGVVVDADHIIRTSLPHPLVQNEGFSPLQACSEALDTVSAIDRARYATVQNTCNPSSVVQLDPTVKYPSDAELSRLYSQLYQLHGGPDKSGRIAFLSGGMTLEPYSPGKIETPWVESWSQLVSFVLSVFGVNSSLAFLAEDTSFAALYAALRQFNLFTLCPLLDMIADSLNHHLVAPFYGDDIMITLTPKRVDNEEQEEASIGNDLSCGCRTVNEIRTSRGLPEVEWGDERAYAGFKPEPEPKPAEGGLPGVPAVPEEQSEDPAVAAGRPENEQGEGSLGPEL